MGKYPNHFDIKKCIDSIIQANFYQKVFFLAILLLQSKYFMKNRIFLNGFYFRKFKISQCIKNLKFTLPFKEKNKVKK